ncbi:MAG: hypothetical protein AB7S49_05400 [Arcobacter sp.]|jgi:hypothetical protein|uniref:Uncharacterized protein n=1 Tax=Arcobacter defluvii TaxID=873191 RepID=A0AAE7E7J4_9BACT|nr:MULTISPECIES: hypothetical protein [Arcobacter]MDY3200855.1 hypothetical protein [Arcobacter sp.]QKF78156.1 hypothetical protein ADFLV_2147 [Arcobacter defluvii]RXI33265.1 hypothetical protein CP964_06735 [Arcobacter defluvii]BAK73971.1 conserved hypothetical protein [Arcobacter sp. L]
MKKSLFFIFMVFSFSTLFADQWDGFFKETGFPRKVIDDGSIVKGKLYQAKVSYQISNNDGIKGNFENNDSAKVTITNSKGKVLSTKKFMTAIELRSWARENFTEIFSSVVGEQELNKETLKELTKLASVVLLNKNLE